MNCGSFNLTNILRTHYLKTLIFIAHKCDCMTIQSEQTTLPFEQNVHPLNVTMSDLKQFEELTGLPGITKQMIREKIVKVKD